MIHIQDHPLRYELANEAHTRPFPSMVAPGIVAFLALKQEPGQARDRDADRVLLIQLLERFGAPQHQPDETYYSGEKNISLKVGTAYRVRDIYYISVRSFRKTL